jgi:hypothetical protein
MEARMSENDELNKRDTIRDPNATAGSGNTLRGLNNGAPGADDGPPSSGMGPVVVPGVREPGPVDAPPPEQAALAKKSSVPRLLQQGVTVPPEWLPKAKVEFAEGDEEQRIDYSPPEEAPARTEHKTFELQTVKVDPYADPRTAPTQRKLKPPPSMGPESAPGSAKSPQLVLWIPIILAVLAFAVIVIAAIAFRSGGREENASPVEPAIAPRSPPAPSPVTPTPVPDDPTARVVSPVPTPPSATETTPAAEPSAGAARTKKPTSTSGRPAASKDPFGRAF